MMHAKGIPDSDCEHLDFLVIGAGLSGICQAYHFQKAFPAKSYAVLESRAAMGGTWDLFQYPGIRSDSDMPTLGYSFRPWINDAAIADGPSILQYIKDTAREFGIDRNIRYGQRVTHLSWDSATALWTATVAVTAPAGRVAQRLLTCRFVAVCAGYYDYDNGYTPDWPGFDSFAGAVIHPQHWPRDADYAGKRVTVIGSGATAVTLVPRLAETAAHVTMLQRSPTYIVSAPTQDKLTNRIRRTFGDRFGHFFARWKNTLVNIAIYQISQRRPAFMINLIRKGTVAELGEDYDVDRHFKPSYKPWDQRICVVPEGDLFKSIRSGKVDVVTDRIKTFTAQGITLESGQQIETDIVVTATGLQMKIAGGIQLAVDGTPLELGDTFSYKGAMYSGVPNFSVALGYINAAWTMKCELIARYVVRLMQVMDKKGVDFAVPNAPRASAPRKSTFELTSGYLERVRSKLPKQTDYGPWRLNQNYLKDFRLMRMGTVSNEMVFGKAKVPLANALPVMSEGQT
jgi:monooxygenase